MSLYRSGQLSTRSETQFLGQYLRQKNDGKNAFALNVSLKI